MRKKLVLKIFMRFALKKKKKKKTKRKVVGEFPVSGVFGAFAVKLDGIVKFNDMEIRYLYAFFVEKFKIVKYGALVIQ